MAFLTPASYAGDGEDTLVSSAYPSQSDMNQIPVCYDDEFLSLCALAAAAAANIMQRRVCLDSVLGLGQLHLLLSLLYGKGA